MKGHRENDALLYWKIWIYLGEDFFVQFYLILRHKKNKRIACFFYV